jgi:hypothetical protein
MKTSDSSKPEDAQLVSLRAARVATAKAVEAWEGEGGTAARTRDDKDVQRPRGDGQQ